MDSTELSFLESSFSPFHFSCFPDAIVNDPVMSSPTYQLDEVDIASAEVSLGRSATPLFDDEFINSSCALSSSETSPGYTSEDLMADFLLEDDAFNSGGSAPSSPIFDDDLSPMKKVKRDSAGGGLPIVARRVIKVYPTCVSKHLDDIKPVDISYRNKSHLRQGKKIQSMNQNAINARENRERKKKYINDLEDNVKRLMSENKALKAKVNSTDEVIFKLQKELEYARSIVANQGPLSNILGGLLKAAPELRIRAPLLCTFPSETDSIVEDQEANKLDIADLKQTENVEAESEKFKSISRYPNRKRNAKSKDFPPQKSIQGTLNNISRNIDHNYNRRNAAVGGICVHISHDDVSLEMCSDCSLSAQQSLAEGS